MDSQMLENTLNGSHPHRTKSRSEKIPKGLKSKDYYQTLDTSHEIFKDADEEIMEFGQHKPYTENDVKQEEDDKPLPLTESSNSFIEKESLHAHQGVHKQEKNFRCKEYKEEFAYTSVLQHQMIHTTEELHECADCGINFADKSDFLQHQMIHTSKKNFQMHRVWKMF
ncbi:zinc finger protein 184-like [Bombina bombina]|uniref:zinc finger protein 184-like n=1 Tax=Bombina bombina TaxID=8345 RepID=UPI00235B0A7E|nr:zinc finger protein 184-like [Bombina bombina]